MFQSFPIWDVKCSFLFTSHFALCVVWNSLVRTIKYIQFKIKNVNGYERCVRAVDLKFTLNLDDLCDSVVHLLDGLELSESHSPLVGDVVDSTLGLSVLSTGSTHLRTETQHFI